MPKGHNRTDVDRKSEDERRRGEDVTFHVRGRTDFPGRLPCHTNRSIPILICSLMIVAGSMFSEIKMQVRDGHPLVDGVYVDGHGPYRFLLDTGTNVNLIEPRLAESIGLVATFRTELATSTGATNLPGRDGVEIQIGSVKADGQKFLFSRLDAIHNRWPDVHGVLGQWFLSRFDYTLDLLGKRIEFGKEDRRGTRAPFRMMNGRMALSTSLGELVLDSGADRVVLFGVQPDVGRAFMNELRTVTGSRQVGMIFSKPLIIEGRRIWRGAAVAMPDRAEPGVDGLLPLRLFKAIHVCNSESHVIFE
jgi:predicted aspartyl protease